MGTTPLSNKKQKLEDFPSGLRPMQVAILVTLVFIIFGITYMYLSGLIGADSSESIGVFWTSDLIKGLVFVLIVSIMLFIHVYFAQRSTRKREKQLLQDQIALQRNKERYRAIVSSLNEIIFVHDEENRFIDAHYQPDADLALQPEKFLGHNLCDLFPGDICRRYEHTAEKVRQSGITETFEYSLTLQGAEKWYSAKLNLHENGKYIVSSITDITEQKKIERAHRQSEQSYHHIYQHAPVGIFATNSEGKPLSINNTMANLLGCDTPEEALGYYTDLGTQLYVNPERREEFVRQIAESGSVENFEYQAKTLDDRIIWLSMNASIEAWKEDNSFIIVGFATDITERKQQEKEYRELIDGMNDTAFVTNSEGKFLAVNETAIQVLGYSREEFSQMGPVDIDAQMSNEEIRNLQNDIGTDIQRVFETKHKTKSGKTIPVEISSSSITYRGDPAILSIVRDITKRKQAERALRESEKRYHTIFEHSIDAIYLYNLKGKIIDVNKKALEQSGYQRNELVGSSVFDHISGDPDKENILEQWQAVKIGQEILTESVYCHKSGKPYPVQIKTGKVNFGNAEFMLAIVHDLTEQKALMREQTRLTKAINQIGEAIVITDPNGNIQYVNPAFEEITGYASEEAVGEKPNILKSGEHDKDFYRELWKTISSGNTWEGRFKNQRNDGTIYIEEAVISPVIDETDQIINYVAVKRDISDEIALENQLHQSQKMEAIGRLAGGIAHDFNNLLTIIKGYAKLLSQSLSDTKQKEMVSLISKAGNQASDLTAQLLAFSRKQQLAPKLIKPDSLLENMVPMLRRMLGEDIELHLQLKKRNSQILIDPGQFEQILMNLSVNARDAMPKGGELQIACQRVHTESLPMKLRNELSENSAGFYCLSVSDTGVGIDKKTLAQIFEPFFTTKEVGEGTGLGLSTVFGIVKQSDGAIDVESEPGVGTTFTIYFPIVEKDAEKASISRPVNNISLADRKILVLDDEPGILKFVRIILEKNQMIVKTVNTGIAAIDSVKSAEQPFEILLTDVVLPGKSGVEIAEKCLEIQPDLSILFMTGYTDDRIENYFSGTENIALRKPFDAEELRTAIMKSLAG